MSRIIVGIDGSESSRNAFQQAVREAEWRGADLHVVHVIHYPISMGYGVGYVDFDTIHKAGAAFLETELEKLAEPYDPFPVAMTSEVVLGHAGYELAELAKGNEDTEPAALVVVGTRGLGGVRSLLLGSVTTYLAHHVEVPLLIIPDADT